MLKCLLILRVTRRSHNVAFLDRHVVFARMSHASVHHALRGEAVHLESKLHSSNSVVQRVRQHLVGCVRVFASFDASLQVRLVAGHIARKRRLDYHQRLPHLELLYTNWRLRRLR